ncbi:phospho-2-dehydro-3-deoxyheptonate aldolase [Escherichia phage EcS1]|uniref:3-deoxy-7-phosphoheptulonate synthase n=1 Tax=Escherichia phage EcS1 TaxID=2083276 RepID=A0A2Z5ZCX3_9CAUD|nr:phospho-2-dehydro-3-deoxyheptonate aldolase [Escherichia phage EcS1]BBC78282.1 Phospho-2-dehydro-deoxyheptonate aldolase [Escherichia phage EcS1]
MNLVVEQLYSPNELARELPFHAGHKEQVEKHREEVNRIMCGENHRKLVVVGPCSIHDPKAALEYGQRLAELQKQLPDVLLVMRVYFEKPRTTVGWKGYVNDPHLNDTFDLNYGLHCARRLCLDLLDIGLPLATEVLDPFTIKYLSGIFSWVAIGARTTESQTHREIASGLPMCVGFKNGTNGSAQVAIDAMKSAAFPHRYLGMDNNGNVGIVHAVGNKNTHIVLRGGDKGPNYHEDDIVDVLDDLYHAGVNQSVMVDCSHSNSEKDFTRQPGVAKEVLKAGFQLVKGFMIESHLNEGSQKISRDMKYGVSVTDACIGWEQTVKTLTEIDQYAKRKD